VCKLRIMAIPGRCRWMISITTLPDGRRSPKRSEWDSTPQLGRFMQADTIVPPHQGTQGFDRYAYINNNPVNGTDPSGNWLIPGWDDTYILNQGHTNRCAIFSLAMASSVVSEMKVDEAKLEQAWIWQKLGLDWGIPPALQPGGVNKTFPNIEAKYLQGDKKRIIKFLEQGSNVSLPKIWAFCSCHRI
jgi:hypothetical protein